MGEGPFHGGQAAARAQDKRAAEPVVCARAGGLRQGCYAPKPKMSTPRVGAFLFGDEGDVRE